MLSRSQARGENSLPRDKTNMVLLAIRAGLPRAVCPKALHLSLINRIPIARGLGSSAAARLGGVLAAHALCGLLGPSLRRTRIRLFRRKPESRKTRGGLDPGFRRGECTLRRNDGIDEVLDAACRLEGHPDNVVPAFYGGLCAAIRTKERILFAPFEVPRELGAVVCVPDFELSTPKARKVLPQRVSRQDAVRTAARVAFLLHAIERRKFDRLAFSMEDDLHQPYRRKLVPGMRQVIDAAVRAGAFGAALSGAGPSIFAFAPRGYRGAVVGRAMQQAFARVGVGSRSLVLDIDRQGAAVRIVA